MNVLIAKIIKERLSVLPYFDRPAGLVQTITKEDSSDKGKNKVLRFPVEVNLSELKDMKPLIPDESIKGMFYVEDGGIKVEGINDFTTDLTLVCWLCPKRISSSVDIVSASAITDIINILCKPIINESPVTRLRFTASTIPIRDVSIFSKYTYSELQTQYLMPPFDFFAIRLKAGYRLSESCLTSLEPAEPC